ncbi:hypothetical protein LZ24_02541 [Desulfobotulus alkaliphilus]|uniref:Uncharacterized protein n=1 Tax=Desulfobotulus alkaliphilus TaxID=622671 RepID=A0A562RHQ2_9BACT|nr:OmpH family outer membrane protein [Desulfobotulus alkaliphilus]TWI68568.1 hypothetical protein LZ24_02541 [Desulfobotulus alkaliphilus]
MAVAEILEHLGDGKYRVQVACHREWIPPLMEATQKRIDFYEDAMAELLEEIHRFADETTAALNALDKLLWEYAGQQISDARKRAVMDAQTQIQLRRNAENAARAQYAQMDLRLMANQQRMKDLQELKDRVDNDVREIWCADLSENLTGRMPTMEINGEPEHMILAPQSLEPGPDTPDPLPHGMLKPMPAMTAAQAVFNWTIMPGWQKWKPTYRTGVIGSIDTAAGTASLTLDEARSYIKNFEINQEDTLNAVPIDYMDCHAGAFGEGDHVVVMFSDQDFNHPRVIGFVEEPKGCGSVFFTVVNDWESRRSGFGCVYECDPLLTARKGVRQHGALPQPRIQASWNPHQRVLCQTVSAYNSKDRLVLVSQDEGTLVWDGFTAHFADAILGCSLPPLGKKLGVRATVSGVRRIWTAGMCAADDEYIYVVYTYADSIDMTTISWVYHKIMVFDFGGSFIRESPQWRISVPWYNMAPVVARMQVTGGRLILGHAPSISVSAAPECYFWEISPVTWERRIVSLPRLGSVTNRQYSPFATNGVFVFFAFNEGDTICCAMADMNGALLDTSASTITASMVGNETFHAACTSSYVYFCIGGRVCMWQIDADEKKLVPMEDVDVTALIDMGPNKYVMAVQAG